MLARPWCFYVSLLAIGILALTSQRSFAQTVENADQASKPIDATTGEATAKQDAERAVYFDLGPFRVRELRPTRNETIDVRFSLHLKLPPATSQRTQDSLIHMQHRLRDQVIVAVRLSSSGDFAEPRLERLQRTILRRVNRILSGLRIESLYLMDFSAAEI